MADPALVSLPADTWTIVATNVTSGQIKKMDSKPNLYLETYRMTGNDGPVGISEGALMFMGGNSETISASAGIDVYVMSVGNDGTVRVDV
jgi:hypothetical protein